MHKYELIVRIHLNRGLGRSGARSLFGLGRGAAIDVRKETSSDRKMRTTWEEAHRRHGLPPHSS